MLTLLANCLLPHYKFNKIKVKKGNLKADLDGTIFAYHYHAWLTYILPSHQIVLCKLDPGHPYDMCGCHRENCVHVDGQKSRRMLVMQDSRKQKSYCLNQHLHYHVI